MFSFRWISILLISITFCTYLANIVLSRDLTFIIIIIDIIIIIIINRTFI